jgi:hypothetical protein
MSQKLYMVVELPEHIAALSLSDIIYCRESLLEIIRRRLLFELRIKIEIV